VGAAESARAPRQAALPVGWAENVAPALFRGINKGWEDGQAQHRNL